MDQNHSNAIEMNSYSIETLKMLLIKHDQDPDINSSKEVCFINLLLLIY